MLFIFDLADEVLLQVLSHLGLRDRRILWLPKGKSISKKDKVPAVLLIQVDPEVVQNNTYH